VIVARDAIHEAADGRRYLVTHGDEFDGVVQHARWLAMLGDWSYRALLTIDTHYNRLRRVMGLGYWSLPPFLKHQVKDAVAFIDRFEGVMAEETHRQGVQVVICGHIHPAEIRDFGGVTYLNDRDWVESCAAIVEDHDGQFRLINCLEERRRLIPAPRAV
jgi:UDP-2,3-diacylglucosamine pyrophosphatase LpxH